MRTVGGGWSWAAIFYSTITRSLTQRVLTFTLELRKVVYNPAQPALANLDLPPHVAKIADNS
ncbi:hypothetical protein TOL_1962 [Thalassolituus oleivorans MIL-1]|uniref:Uncharacterized protein n=1 Tax=Thalassolituus oleivorans MIL-1 TaxID=1298593 RepID=M5DSG2_9GAMM|nr:hypothetical protein TOL_1962 [Thalassolituus oleivorans MIL-1]